MGGLNADRYRRVSGAWWVGETGCGGDGQWFWWGGNVIYLDDGNVLDGIYIGAERTVGTCWDI